MKKTLSLILSLVMLLTLLAGCSNDEGDSSSESEQEVEQSENLLETEIYYDTIELSKSDFLEIPPTNILLYGYVDFESYLTEDALEKVDESLLEGKVAVLCYLKSGFEITGFKKIEYFNSKPKIICENTSYYPYDIFATEYNPDRIIAVLVPSNEIPKGLVNVDFGAEPTSGYTSKRMVHAPQLGDEEKVLLFKTEKELLDFEEQNNISHLNYAGYTPNEKYVILLHYMPITHHNQTFVKYQNFAKSGDNTFTIERFEIYNGEIGSSNNSSSLFYVRVPRTEFAESENLTGNVVRVVEKTNNTSLKKTASSQYLSVLYTLEGEECEFDFLPSKHGTYMVLAKNEIEAAALGLGEDSINSIYYDNYVLVLYRYCESHEFKTVGFRNLRHEEGKYVLTVDEVKKDTATEEYKSLSYIVIPKTQIDKIEFRFELDSNEIEYYDFEKGRGNVSRDRAYYMYHTYEDFVNDWSNDVDPEIFNTHFALAIRRYKGMGVDYTIGYRDFYLRDNVIHITLDEGVTYVGDAAIHEWFDIVFIPKELACLEYKLEISANRIHNNAVDGY